MTMVGVLAEPEPAKPQSSVATLAPGSLISIQACKILDFSKQKFESNVCMTMEYN
jgi:hypothetical protein